MGQIEWRSIDCSIWHHYMNVGLTPSPTTDSPCDWDADVCSSAAAIGHLEVLKWARAQKPPCPRDINECIETARDKNDIETLTFLRVSCLVIAYLLPNVKEEREMVLTGNS